MKINKLAWLSLTFIFFILPFITFAAIDSTSPEIQPPPLTRQCYTARVNGVTLAIQPTSIKATVEKTDCSWRGLDGASWWGLAITNATYEQSCSTDEEVAVGMKFGIRGDFLLGGDYDLYVYCCKLKIKYTVSHDWQECPTPTASPPPPVVS